MLFYYSPANAKLKVQFAKLDLTTHPKHLEQIAVWVETKWGYLRGFLGMEYRLSAIIKIADHFHVMTYGGQLIGCFALFDRPVENGEIKKKRFKVPELKVKGIIAKELMYVYIDEPFRGLGLGKVIVNQAKAICENEGANMIVLDTLNTNLNHFYENCGAKVVCEGELLKHPTSILRM